MAMVEASLEGYEEVSAVVVVAVAELRTGLS